MSKRRGLSVEEKRKKTLDFFYERKDFFQLKELEKLLPKEKGVISQSVKEIVQSLVDDGLVDTDKVGSCVYFWAFPSKATSNKQNKINSLKNRIEESTLKLQDVMKKMEKISEGRQENSERTEALELLYQLQEENQNMKCELKKYEDSDPQSIQKMKDDTKTALEAANIWTDNIFGIKTWCKNKFFIEESVLNKQFEIPEEMDYLN